MKLIKDPIHGYIELGEDEVDVVDTRAFQRLRRIIQLPFVYLVYPGARHCRFDHSLGCMYLAGELAERLGLDEHRRKVLRLAGLLHDLGHTPYSHLLEPLLQEKGLSHEQMTIRIIREDEELGEALRRCGVDPEEIVEVLEKKVPEGAVISGPFDVDKLDFLVRDSYFTGAAYGLVDAKRILWRSRIVGGRLALSLKAVGAVEEMAIARYQSFMNIYFHHAVRAAQTLFLRGVRTLSDELDFSSMSLEEYLSHDDYTVWCMMRNRKETREIVERIERRRLPKVAYELKAEESGITEKLRSREKIREAEEELAHIAGVPSKYLWIDTPYVPPLPYMDEEEIQFYQEDERGARLVHYSSPLLRFTSRIYEIVRVYTEKEYLERVRRAAERYFEEG